MADDEMLRWLAEQRPSSPMPEEWRHAEPLKAFFKRLERLGVMQAPSDSALVTESLFSAIDAAKSYLR